jgi:hypothetical protein
MQLQQPHSTSEIVEVASDSHRATARGDFFGSLAWVAFGTAVFVASLRMDRLEAQGVNPYTAPGLVPGLLGLGMMFFGSLMLLRSLRHGGLRAPRAPAHAGSWARIATVVALCVVYAVGLVGHGVPFWLASALFVSVTIAVLRLREWQESGRLPRGLLETAAIGLGAGGLIAFVFEQFFLVRLP